MTHKMEQPLKEFLRQNEKGRIDKVLNDLLEIEQQLWDKENPRTVNRNLSLNAYTVLTDTRDDLQRAIHWDYFIDNLPEN